MIIDNHLEKKTPGVHEICWILFENLRENHEFFSPVEPRTFQPNDYYLNDHFLSRFVKFILLLFYLLGNRINT